MEERVRVLEAHVTVQDEAMRKLSSHMENFRFRLVTATASLDSLFRRMDRVEESQRVLVARHDDIYMTVNEKIARREAFEQPYITLTDEQCNQILDNLYASHGIKEPAPREWLLLMAEGPRDISAW